MMRQITYVVSAVGVMAFGCLPLGDLDAAASGQASGGAGGEATGGAAGISGTGGSEQLGGAAGSAAATGAAGSSAAGTGAAGAAGSSAAGTGAAGASGAGTAGTAGDPSGYCGDGIQNSGEQCDESGLTLDCNPDCTTALCSADCKCDLLAGQRYMFCAGRQRSAGILACSSADMELVRIDSAGENAMLREHATTEGFAGFLWLGARDRESNGVWTWEDGDVLYDVSGSIPTELFTFWAEAPSMESEACAVMDSGGAWLTVACSNVYDVVCEYSPDG